MKEQEAVVFRKRMKPLGQIPRIHQGSEPMDNGWLLLTREEKKKLTGEYDSVRKYIRPYQSFGAQETPYCLWLLGCWEAELERMEEVSRRVESVRKYRLSVKTKYYQERSRFPYLFGVLRQPVRPYLALPAQPDLKYKKRFPVKLLDETIIAGEDVLTVEFEDYGLYALMNSQLYLDWMRFFLSYRNENSGRLTVQLAYNSFPYIAVHGRERERLDLLGRELANRQELRQSAFSCSAEIYEEINRAVERIYNVDLLYKVEKRLETLLYWYRRMAAEG